MKKALQTSRPDAIRIPGGTIIIRTHSVWVEHISLFQNLRQNHNYYPFQMTLPCRYCTVLQIETETSDRLNEATIYLSPTPKRNLIIIPLREMVE